MRRSDDIQRCWSSGLDIQPAAVRLKKLIRATNYDLDDSPAQRSFIYFAFHYYHHTTEEHTQRALTLYPLFYLYSNHTHTHTHTHTSTIDGVSVQVLHHYYHTSTQHLGQSKELGTFLFVYTHTWLVHVWVLGCFSGLVIPPPRRITSATFEIS